MFYCTCDRSFSANQCIGPMNERTNHDVVPTPRIGLGWGRLGLGTWDWVKYLSLSLMRQFESFVGPMHWFFSGVFRNVHRGPTPRGYIAGVHFQKCSTFSIEIFFTLKISNGIKNFPQAQGPPKYAPVGFR